MGQKLQNIKENIVDTILSELTKHPCSYLPSYQDNKNIVKRFPKNVVNILENSFLRDKYPNDDEKVELAKRCFISIRQVNNWFTNKRNRSKINDIVHPINDDLTNF